MKRALVAAAFVVVACAASIESARADAVWLQLGKTGTPGEVRLLWSGGIPSYTIYRSASPANIFDPGNQLGVTDDLEWLDIPPGSLVFFNVESPCTAVPPAVCCLNDGYCLGTEFCDFGSWLCSTKKNK